MKGNTLITRLRSTMLILASALLGAAGIAPAMQLSDVRIPITRREADEAFTKDYEFAVLVDGTVRRTWDLDGKKLSIDFDTNTDNAILITIDYIKPVPKQEGIDEAHQLARGLYSEDAKWEYPKNPEFMRDVLGMNNPRRKALVDKMMLFYETNNSKTRVTRVSLFALKPTTNRWALAEASVGDRRTAMGNRIATANTDAIYKDEETRRATPSAASVAAAATATAGNTKPQVASATPAKPAQTQPRRQNASHTPIVVKPRQEPLVVELDQGRKRSKSNSFLLNPPTLLKDYGIVEEPTWWHYIGIAVVALLLLIFIIRSISHGASKAAQRKKFAQVIAQGAPKKSAKKIRR